MGARRLVQAMTDAVLNRVPVIGGIYNTSKQLVSMLDRQDPGRLAGHERRVLYLWRGPGDGVSRAAGVTPGYFVGGRECKIVIVPTAPVPFGGGLLLVPSECILTADMSVEGLMSIYVSMGVTAPQYMKQAMVLPQSNAPKGLSRVPVYSLSTVTTPLIHFSQRAGVSTSRAPDSSIPWQIPTVVCWPD